MTEQAQDEPTAAEPRRRSRFWRVVRWTAGTLVVLLLVAVVGGFLAFRHLDQNITALHPDLGDDRPERVTVLGKLQPINLLIIGSDTRAGQDSISSGAGGDLSDTTILLHLSANRKRAYGVSIPRDLMVNRPECPSKSGSGTVPGDPEVMFNTAYGVGREGCTIRTVEAMTDIRIDHFLVSTFDGFRSVANALGGVPICVPEEIRDPRLDVVLPVGRYDVKGEQALAYVSTRLGVGDGSDVGRMKRQQAFLASMTGKALSAGTLSNPFKLYNFLDEATKAIAVDEDLASLKKLADLARQVRQIGLDKVEFLTMPIAPYEPDPNRLAAGPGAPALWSALRNDEPLTEEQLSEGTTPDDQAASAGRPAPFRSSGGVTGAGPALREDLVPDQYGLCS